MVRKTPPKRKQPSRADRHRVYGEMRRLGILDPNDGLALGRPGKYSPRYVPIVKRMVELGATDAELAEALEVETLTIRNWANQHAEFNKALNYDVNKDILDGRAKRAFFSRVVGFSHDTEKIFVTRDGEIVRVPTKEYVPPNVQAGQFWLRNRVHEFKGDRGDGTTVNLVSQISVGMDPRAALESFAALVKGGATSSSPVIEGKVVEE